MAKFEVIDGAESNRVLRWSFYRLDFFRGLSPAQHYRWPYRPNILLPATLAYNGGPFGSTFTPISAYAGLSTDLRRQLTETKIEPAAERPAPPPVRQAEAATAPTPLRSLSQL